MSKADLEKFSRLVLENLEIQDHLKELIDREDFIQKVLELGKNAGFEITREDVIEQMREKRRLWNERWI